MKFLTTPQLFHIVAVTVLLSAASPGFAQPSSPPSNSPSNPATTAPLPGSISVDFPGGTVGQLVDLINKTDSQRLNLVGEKQMMEMQVPALSVRDVTARDIAIMLGQLLESKGLIVSDSLQQGFQQGMISQTDYRLFTLRKDPHFAWPYQPYFNCVDLTPYLTHFSIDQIVSALRTSWDMSPQNKPDDLVIKFHPETKLLFIFGSIHNPHSEYEPMLVLGVLKSSAEKASQLSIESHAKP